MFPILSSKYRELTETPLCLVPGQTSSATVAPDSLKLGRETLQARIWKGVENREFNQIQKFFRPYASNNKCQG